MDFKSVFEKNRFVIESYVKKNGIRDGLAKEFMTEAGWKEDHRQLKPGAKGIKLHSTGIRPPIIAFHILDTEAINPKYERPGVDFPISSKDAM
jgi:hypothetical protein